MATDSGGGGWNPVDILRRWGSGRFSRGNRGHHRSGSSSLSPSYSPIAPELLEDDQPEPTSAINVVVTDDKSISERGRYRFTYCHTFDSSIVPYL